MKINTNSFVVYSSITCIKRLWQTLYAQNTTFSFYQSYAWNECLEKRQRKQFVRSEKLEYWVFKERVIFPLLFDNELCQIHLLGYADSSDYLSPIFSNEGRELVEEAILSLHQQLSGYQLIFSKISEKSTFYAVLEKLRGKLSCEKTPSVCMCIDTQTYTPTFYDSLSKSARNTYRTACNRIKKQGWKCEVSVSFTCLSARKATQLYKLYRLRRQDCDSRAQWYKKLLFFIKRILEISGLYRSHDPLTSYSQLCPVFLAQVHINGELAGFCEGGLSNDGHTLCVSRVATNKTYYHYSPGQILFIRAIDEIKHTVRYFDLTRGNENYKIKLGAKPHYNYIFTIRNFSEVKND